MKTVIKSLLIVFLTLLTAIMNAQIFPVSIGVKGGANVSNFGGEGLKDADGKIGFVGGIVLDYNIDELVFIRSGLDITTKGATNKKETVEYTYTPMYLQMPVHVGYKMPFSNLISCSLHAGPYLAYGVGGKTKVSGASQETENDESDFFGNKENGGFKKLDFGLGLGVGIEIGKVGFDFGYDLGLANVSYVKDAKMKNISAYLAFIYKF